MPPAKNDHKWNAEDYARHSSAQLEWARELIAKLALEGGESILDVGCGEGKVTAELARATTGRVVGIDLSEDMIELASKRHPPEDYPNLSFQRMDAGAIRLAESFDVAFSNAALHWVKDHEAVLRGVRACLNPGGRLLFQMGGRGNARDVFAVIEALVKAPRWRGYFKGFTAPYHFYGPEDYEKWLKKNGFCSLRCELAPKDMRHQGAEGLKGWLRTTWFPYTDSLPVELREAFLTELVAAYITAHPLDDEGCAHVPMVRLEAEARAL